MSDVFAAPMSFAGEVENGVKEVVVTAPKGVSVKVVSADDSSFNSPITFESVSCDSCSLK